MFLPVGVRGAVCQKVYAADFRPIGNLFRLAVIKTDTNYTQTIVLPVHGVLIAEGVFLQRAPLKNQFDKIIYLSVPECVRLNRVLQKQEYACASCSEKVLFPEPPIPSIPIQSGIELH